MDCTLRNWQGLPCGPLDSAGGRIAVQEIARRRSRTAASVRVALC
jgi:hypothetical protein